MGCDCEYDKNGTSNYIIFLAKKEDRIILTRNKRMIHVLDEKNSRIDCKVEKKLIIPVKETVIIEKEDLNSSDEFEEIDEKKEINDYFFKYFYVNGKHPKEQISQVLNHFKIEFSKDLIFSRCLNCNTLLQIVDKRKRKEKYLKPSMRNRIYFTFAPNVANFIGEPKREIYM